MTEHNTAGTPDIAIAMAQDWLATGQGEMPTNVTDRLGWYAQRLGYGEGIVRQLIDELQAALADETTEKPWQRRIRQVATGQRRVGMPSPRDVFDTRIIGPR